MKRQIVTCECEALIILYFFLKVSKLFSVSRLILSALLVIPVR